MGKKYFDTKKDTLESSILSVWQEAAKKAIEHGVSSVDVKVKGPGAGRENAIRALLGVGLKITSVADKSPMPHNGCRAPKRRRV